MARRTSTDERKALKRAFKRSERAVAREHMVLDEASLAGLIEHVEAALAERRCDHTLRAARDWAVLHDVDPDVLAASLAHFGGYCDCEVAANVDPGAIFDPPR